MPRKKPAAPKRPKFEVSAHQYIQVTFPDAGYGSWGAYDMSKTLTASEARLLAGALNSAANEIKE